tara:strand:+ start:3484 stop:4638 length:1155 start_codon:yes stop_codon:yes gene_type:complete
VKKVLLIGSSYSALTILKSLKNLKYNVTVCGKNKNEPCHKFANSSIFLDYSNLKNTKFVDLSLYDYIVPSFNDAAYLFATKLSEHKKIPGYDSFNLANAIQKKDLYKKLLEESDIPTLDYIKFYSTDLSVANIYHSFPAIIKPTNSFSGKGCVKILNKSNLIKVLKKLKRTSYLIENFFDGSLHSYSAFIKNKKIVKDFYVDEFTTNFQFQVNCSNSPSTLKKNIKVKIKKLIVKFIETHNLADGLFHTQFLKKNNKIFLVESMRRGPGDLYNVLIEQSLGYDYTLNYLMPFLGKNYNFKKLSKTKYLGRYTLDEKKNGDLMSIKLNYSFRKTNFFPLKVVGEDFFYAPNDKLGIIFVEYNTINEMTTITPKLDEYFLTERVLL